MEEPLKQTEVLMDHIPPREKYFGVDLEAGETTSEEVGRIDTVSGGKLARNFFAKLCQGFISADGSVKGETGASLSLSNSGVVSPEKVKILVHKKVVGEEAADLTENKMGKEKRKKTSTKKPPKPPRPPRGLSLDAADQKLIKEIADLAMMKRARIERMKALKKMKAAKASSSSGNVFAMLFTIIFCLVIFFQGVSSRSSAVSFQGSPQSARATEDGVILNGSHYNPSASDTILLGSGSPDLLEQVYGSDPDYKGNRATR